MVDLSKTVRTQEVLNRAWHAIRRNAETSKSRETRQEARDFGYDLIKNLRRIMDRLRKDYQFAPAHGATPPKGKGKTGKRPLVIAPIEDRIVQRAILDTLSDCNSLENVQRVLATPTSIGGIKGRGVDTAIKMFDERVAQGDRFMAASDIAGFFTKVPREQVVDFVRQDTDDEAFLELLDRALTVELANEAQLSEEDRELFPTGPDGVAQGCPLSALAGNIVLQNFDLKMNEAGRGVTCIRYIDDFILLGAKTGMVQGAMRSAKRELSALGMDVYDPVENPDKAFIGEVGEAKVFLGYELVPGRYPPSPSSRDKLMGQVDALLKHGRNTIAKAANGKATAPNDRAYIQTLTAIDNTLKGWRGSYKMSDCPDVFRKMDTQVQRKLRDFDGYRRTKSKDKSAETRRSIMGIKNLADDLANDTKAATHKKDDIQKCASRRGQG